MSIENRKQDHIELALLPQSQGPLTTLFEDAVIVHNALPNISYEKIDTSTTFLGFKLSAPIIISGMTGGTEKAYELNKKLAQVAEEFRIALGVGSQRAMIENPSLINTYRVVRETAPSIPIISNIGFAQLKKLSMEQVESLVTSIEANALAIHLNAAQELVQLEGDRDFEDVVSVIEKLTHRLSVPIIIKEVGNGLSKEVVETLYAIGIRVFDVAGAGGTNWVRIELMRIAKSDKKASLYGEPFVTWGIPTAASICEARAVANEIIVIGSGGIRTGVDVAKAIALGADIVGIAQPFLRSIIVGGGREYVSSLLAQLKVVMALTGVRSVMELQNVPIVIMGRLAQWICARKLRLRNTRAYIHCCSNV
jgi:isopentenyl-diphosphate delta-isomerase